jgi:hypothetical protein
MRSRAAHGALRKKRSFQRVPPLFHYRNSPHPNMHPSLKDQWRSKLELAIDAEYPPSPANSAFRKQVGL